MAIYTDALFLYEIPYKQSGQSGCSVETVDICTGSNNQNG